MRSFFTISVYEVLGLSAFVLFPRQILFRKFFIITVAASVLIRLKTFFDVLLAIDLFFGATLNICGKWLEILRNWSLNTIYVENHEFKI